MSEPATQSLAVETRGLTKRFSKQTVVADLDMAVPHGAVYGFLGPNGSGKTTTIRMLLGLVSPTSGTRSLLGFPLPDGATHALHRVGALVEGPAFHPYLSGRANLARLDAADRYADPGSSRSRIDAALDQVGLLAAAGKHYRAYSLGMRQRLGIAAALLSQRDLLILDEPTNGLDPQGTREVRSLIGSLGADGITIVVSSHLLTEVEQVCTHLGVLREGRMVAQGRVTDLRADQTAQVRVSSTDPVAATRVLQGLGVGNVTSGPGHVLGVPGSIEPEKIVASLVEAGVGVRGFSVEAPSLEDWFVELTGEGFDVSG